MSDVTRVRIQALLDQLGLSANRACVEAGIDRQILGRFLRGRVNFILDENLRAVAKVLGVDPAYLRGEQDVPRANAVLQEGTVAKIPTMDLPIVGIVEAGAFRPRDWFDDAELGVVVNGFDPAYAGIEQVAWLVRGDSMTLAGVDDGDHVTTIDPWEAMVDLSTGDLVVVVRRIAQGQQEEYTLKELHVFDDRYELRPRSSNPKHQPIVVPRGYDLSDDHEIIIKGVVIGTRKSRLVKFLGRNRGASGLRAGARKGVAASSTVSKLLKGAVLASFALGVTTPCHALALGAGPKAWTAGAIEREVLGRSKTDPVPLHPRRGNFVKSKLKRKEHDWHAYHRAEQWAQQAPLYLGAIRGEYRVPAFFGPHFTARA